MAFGRVLAADDGELPERALQRRREEPDPLHAAAARRRDDGRPLTEELKDPSYLDQCAVGFSSVIFALKVLVNSDSLASIFDLSAWSELLIIQLLVPNASFIGHLAGILAGVAYVWGAALFRVALKPLFVALEYPATTSIAALIMGSHFGWIRKPWKTKHFWYAFLILYLYIFLFTANCRLF